jgi:hypothetical protein
VVSGAHLFWVKFLFVYIIWVVPVSGLSVLGYLLFSLTFIINLWIFCIVLVETSNVNQNINNTGY